MHTPPLRAPAGLTALVAALLLSQAAATLASAAPSNPTQKAHRCTSAQGAVSYSQQPCGDGSMGRLVDAQDERTDAQRQQAQANLRKDKALAHDQAWQARLQADHAARQKPSDLSGKVKPVAVGQREVDRRGVPTEPLTHNPKQFRTKAPRKAARSASSAA